MTLPERIKQQAQGAVTHADLVRPELASRAERIWLIMEPGLKNFAPSELGLLRDYLVAKLTEYRAIQELEVLNAEQELALTLPSLDVLRCSHGYYFVYLQFAEEQRADRWFAEYEAGADVFQESGSLTGNVHGFKTFEEAKASSEKNAQDLEAML